MTGTWHKDHISNSNWVLVVTALQSTDGERVLLSSTPHAIY